MRLRSTDISARTLGDETIVLNLPTSRYFTITGVGTRVFEPLAEETSLNELIGLRDVQLLLTGSRSCASWKPMRSGWVRPGRRSSRHATS